ncbi:hypothetical protein ABX014_08930 [Snodgrassella alvi]|uniref:hypothetical protein n=1 Tax=Snodgrassella alvi TaxID=1196083 RepID=UPI00346021C0
MIEESGSNKRQSLYLYTGQYSYEPLTRIDRTGNQEQQIYYFNTDLNGMPEKLTDETNKGFEPHKIDMSTVSDKLKIIQRGNDLKHFKIVPAQSMPLIDYVNELAKIKVY